jgi:hypothetical protein
VLQARQQGQIDAVADIVRAAQTVAAYPKGIADQMAALEALIGRLYPIISNGIRLSLSKKQRLNLLANLV